MYFENTNANRATWKYTHKGSQLVVEAQRLHDEAFKKEMAARNRLADLMKDPTVPHGGEDVLRAKSEIDKWGKQREECAVFTYEFAENPEREFHLALGDVVFFGLAPLLNVQEEQ